VCAVTPIKKRKRRIAVLIVVGIVLVVAAVWLMVDFIPI